MAMPAVRRHGWFVAVSVAVVGAMVLAVTRSSLWDSVRHIRLVHPMWLVVGVAAEAVSMITFARTQRRVLSEAGFRLSPRSSLALTYAANALAVTVPVAGSMSGTGFMYHQYLRRGADRAAAGWGLAMAGLFSTSALAALIGVGGIAAGNPVAGAIGGATALLSVVPVVGTLVIVRRPGGRTVVVPVLAGILLVVDRVYRHDRTDQSERAAEAVGRIQQFSISRRGGLAVALFAMINWVADVACLAACVEAFAGPVPWHGLILAYAAGLASAALALTPAGLGIVGGGFTLGLVGAGLASGPALASAVVYRALSCWLVLAIGWVTMGVLRRRNVPQLAPAGV